VLNDRLGRMNALYTGKQWNLWENKNNNPVLSEQAANLLTEATLTIRVAGNNQIVKGYYSKTEDAWCFAIPNGTQKDARQITIQYENGETDSIEVGVEETEYTREMAGIHEQFKFLKNTTIPSFFVNTSGADGDALENLNADKNNVYPGELKLLDEKGILLYDGVVDEVSGRGNDSFLAAKEGYNISLHQKADLLNMGADKDYVLIPGYRDNSLMSYKITEYMAKEMNLPYAPESRFVQLYVDGEYLGMYLLTEKMEIGKNRFNLNNLYKETKEMNGGNLTGATQESWKSDTTSASRVWYDIEKEPADVTGGYLLEVDLKDYAKKQSRFVSDRGVSITLKSNTYASKKQVDYVADYWQDFENALFSESGYNEKGKYYGEYIDIQSFADQWLLYELHEEPSLSGSVYFYKDSDKYGDGLLHAAYLWDVEHSFIEEDNIGANWIMDARRKDLESDAPYWLEFYKHGDFRQMVLQEWTTKVSPAVEKLLQQGEVLNLGGLRSITGYEQLYTDAAAINNSR